MRQADNEMKLAVFDNHVRLDSGLVRRRSEGTSAHSKRNRSEGGVSSESGSDRPLLSLLVRNVGA